MTDSRLSAYSVKFQGEMLKRGFWIYVIDIHAPTGRYLYVGRTGDSSSPNAASPFSRIGEHLDPKSKGNALIRNLAKAGIDPSSCTLEMISVGPIFPEEGDFKSHRPVRDQIAALEHGLACALRDSGHNVLGTHSAPCEPDMSRLAELRKLIELKIAGE